MSIKPNIYMIDLSLPTPASASLYSYNSIVPAVTWRSMARDNRVVLVMVAVILILIYCKYSVVLCCIILYPYVLGLCLHRPQPPSLPTWWTSTANLNTSHYLVGGDDLVQPRRVGKGGRNCTIIFVR